MTMLSQLRQRCLRLGFDVFRPLNVEWYNAEVPAHLRIGRVFSSLSPSTPDSPLDGILIGNSRALWAPFVAYLKENPRTLEHEHPLQQYVMRSLTDALTSLQTTSETRFNYEIRWAHDISPGKLVAMQRLAHVAGVAYLNEDVNLNIHETFGPWCAFRALVLFDTTVAEAGSICPPKLLDPCSASENANMKLRLSEALAALQAPEDDQLKDETPTPAPHTPPIANTSHSSATDEDHEASHTSSTSPGPTPHITGDTQVSAEGAASTGAGDVARRPPSRVRVKDHNIRASWEQWLAIRDACSVGREHRYSDEQIRYHYTKSKDILREAIEA